jgi:hypothetical protein
MSETPLKMTTLSIKNDPQSQFILLDSIKSLSWWQNSVYGKIDFGKYGKRHKN